MSSFQKDVQLLTDLQELISDAERTANMPGYAGAVFNASREHCFHCIKDWLKEESVALRRADDDTE